MLLQPSNLGSLTLALAAAQARGEKVTSLRLNSLGHVLEHTPEDLTVTVEAGITLAALQTQLAQRGQWLPIDPPQPERATIGGVLATNASGPRRFGYGTIREHLLGLRVALADGRLIKAGGKVVKNVAGYDLCKLFVGSHGSLGIIVEATFKLRPLPEAENFVQAQVESMEKTGALIAAVVASELTPMVLDLHNLSTATSQPSTRFVVVLGFAGSREEVEWQLDRARELGLVEPSSLAYEAAFWTGETFEKSRRWSVLPSNLSEALRQLSNVPFVARAGNGVIYYRGGTEPPKQDVPIELARRIKEAYDPKHIFPDLSAG